MDPEPVAETPFDEEGLVEMQSDEVGLVESQSVEELYADSQSDESDIAETQTEEDNFAEVQTDENNYPGASEQESAESEAGFPVQEASPEEGSNDLEAVNADKNRISDQEAEAGTEDQQEVILSEEFGETSFPDSADSEITDASSENGAENLDGEKRFIENNPDEKTDTMPLDNGATNQEFQSVIEQDSDSGDDQNHENTDESISGTADNENNAVENFPENRTLPDLSGSVSEETVADDEKFAGSNPYPTTQDVDGDGNYEVPCTRFAWQQAYDNHGISLPGWGNAVNWFQGAKNSGYSSGSVAQPGSIAVWSGDYYGHVAYVTSASGTTFTVNEGVEQTSTIHLPMVLPMDIG